MDIITPVIALGTTGMALGLFLAIASLKLEKKEETIVAKLEGVLPGINCGGCGYSGCRGYAEAIADGRCGISLCKPGGEDVKKRLAELTGEKEDESVEKKTARVFCGGDNTKTKKKYIFEVEIKGCASANLYFGGDKGCFYGCLGYGDCEMACPFDAIHVNDKGISVVDEEKCTACGKCLSICPKKVIKIVPYKNKHTVLCSSKDSPKESRRHCLTACVSCGLCVESCPEKCIAINDNLAVINPEKCIECGVCELKCPTNAIKGEIKEKVSAWIREELCIGCGACKRVCEYDAVEGELKKKHRISDELCVGCGKCEPKCPVKAIEMETKIIRY